MPGYVQDIFLYWDSVKVLFTADLSRLGDPLVMAQLVLMVFLLCCSAFFSGSETALFSLSRLDMENLRRQRHPQSGTLHELLDQPRQLIISLLCGNELVNIAGSINLTTIMVTLYGIENAGIITVCVMFPLQMLFGEVTPKVIAVTDPVRISSNLIASPIGIWVRWIAPLRWAIRGLADRITSWFVGTARPADNILNINEFRFMVDECAAGNGIQDIERALINNLLEASETDVTRIMTPRTKIKFLSIDMKMAEVVKKMRHHQHPRMPVFSNVHDQIKGFAHVEDIIRLKQRNANLEEISFKDILHPPDIIPETKKVSEMVRYFQTENSRAALVVDEFGGVEGMITMRDVVNFIFGQISSESPVHVLYRERDQDVYDIPGDMRLADFSNLTNLAISDSRMTTIGGVVFRHLGRNPTEGAKVNIDGVDAIVTKTDGIRITRLKIIKGGEVTSASFADGSSQAATMVERPVALAVDTSPPSGAVDVDDDRQSAAQ